VIVRILGEGQRDIPDAEIDGLNAFDDKVAAAIDAGDEERFASALAELLAHVRKLGTEVPADALIESELVLPSADATLAEVRELLGEEGLIPG